MSELKRLAHAMQLPNAIVVIPCVIIVSQSILVLGRLDHNQDVDIYDRIPFVFLILNCGVHTHWYIFLLVLHFYFELY